MKKLIFLLLLAATQSSALRAYTAPDSLGLPGDHFDLYAMIDVFKASSSPEDFEKRLNTEDTRVNNLDLNQDGKTDYIRVVDNTESKAHALVLQDVISSTESQDVAVIEIEKKGDSTVHMQVIGDKLLYGDDYIIDPGTATSEDSLARPAHRENDTEHYGDDLEYNESDHDVFINVYYWPCVTYMYYPGYVVWVSPWYWSYWPGWWTPWPPMGWGPYYGWAYPYHHHHHHGHHHHMHDADHVYGPRRTVSATVSNRVNTPGRTTSDRTATPAKTTPDRTTTPSKTTPDRTTTPTRTDKPVIDRNPQTRPPKTTVPKSPRGTAPTNPGPVRPSAPQPKAPKAPQSKSSGKPR